MDVRPSSWLDRQFSLRLRDTTLRREAIAGLTTFLAAAYLVVVIPSLLATGGMDRAAVTTATIAMMVMGSLAMGLYANFPFVVGPGLGGSVILGVTLTQVEHIPWTAGLGIAALSGLLFFVLTITGARTLVVQLVPRQIKHGLGASIGLFIAMLGCRQAGLVTVNLKTNALLLADFSQPGPVIALTGLAIILALEARRVLGSMLIGIVAAALLGLPLGVSHLPATVVALPHSLAPILFKVDLFALLRYGRFLTCSPSLPVSSSLRWGRPSPLVPRPDSRTTTATCHVSSGPSWWTPLPPPSGPSSGSRL